MLLAAGRGTAVALVVAAVVTVVVAVGSSGGKTGPGSRSRHIQYLTLAGPRSPGLRWEVGLQLEGRATHLTLLPPRAAEKSEAGGGDGRCAEQASSWCSGMGTSLCCTCTLNVGDPLQPGGFPVPSELAVTHSYKALPVYLLPPGGLQDEVVFLSLYPRELGGF